MSVDEVKAALRRGNDLAREGRERLESVAPMITEAGSVIRYTTDDSRDEDVQAAVRGLAEIEKELALTLRRFKAAVDHAERYLGRF